MTVFNTIWETARYVSQPYTTTDILSDKKKHQNRAVM